MADARLVPECDWTSQLPQSVRWYYAGDQASRSSSPNAYSVAPNGKPYVCLTSSGIKEEGVPLRGFHDTSFEAVSAYCREIAGLSKGCNVLVFRRLPEFIENYAGDVVIYSRVAAWNDGVNDV